MKRISPDQALVASLILTLALTACGGASERQRNDTDSAELDILPPDESVSTPTNDLVAGVIDTPPAENYIAPNPDTAIPAALHGRWGLTADDCDSERDDGRGLVTIAADRISFHQSMAMPRTIRNSTRTSIAGTFAFTRNGLSWTGPMLWSVEGRQLVRIDSEADSRLVYTRC